MNAPLIEAHGSVSPARVSHLIRTRIERGLRTKKRFLLLAETFQALGDPSRVQIVWALSHGELSVTELTEVMSMSQPAVSHHLRMLRNLKLVRARRSGRTIHYSLDDEHIERLLREGMRHVEDFL